MKEKENESTQEKGGNARRGKALGIPQLCISTLHSDLEVSQKLDYYQSSHFSLPVCSQKNN